MRGMRGHRAVLFADASIFQLDPVHESVQLDVVLQPREYFGNRFISRDSPAGRKVRQQSRVLAEIRPHIDAVVCFAHQTTNDRRQIRLVGPFVEHAPEHPVPCNTKNTAIVDGNRGPFRNTVRKQAREMTLGG